MKLILLFNLFFCMSTFSSDKVKIQNLDFVDMEKEGHISIKLNERLNEEPIFSITDNVLQVVIPNAYVWPKIEKKISIFSSFDTKVMAYQFDKNTVRFRVLFPYPIEKNKNRIGLVLKDKNINIHFPKSKTKITHPKKNKIAKRKVRKINDFDESYLEKLLKDKESYKEMPKNVVPKNNKIRLVNEKSDKVNTKQSAELKGPSSSFLMTYIGKFVAFLGVLLVVFYLMVNFLRKGTVKKGKLGFLSSTKMVEVLNTTHLGHKKSLMLIKAHEQVFLIGNSEQGLQLISEVKDKVGLFKDGEKTLSGENFDTNLGDANKKNKVFNLKEDLLEIKESEQTSGDFNLVNSIEEEPVKDKVKLSDQIKSKVKGLKSFQ